jgi:hypothetical protein
VRKSIEASADQVAFLFQALGVKPAGDTGSAPSAMP